MVWPCDSAGVRACPRFAPSTGVPWQQFALKSLRQSPDWSDILHNASPWHVFDKALA